MTVNVATLNAYNTVDIWSILLKFYMWIYDKKGLKS